MAHPDRNSIYEATIKRMVAQALAAQEQEFLLFHGADSDEQLLAYLCQCAEELQHTPWPGEIAGGSLIEQRFGTWKDALRKTGLPMPNTPDKASGFARIQAETQRQKTIYREKKAAKKQRAQQRLDAQRDKRKQPL